MWLQGSLRAICWAATRSYYRYTVGGARVPAEGPVLLVANHQNSLVDAAFVVMAAERRVRFLAKAPLFTDHRVGWLVRGTACIPVYRQQDDPCRMEENLGSFRAVHDALAEGAAVGIFPEGTSHRNPSLTPLKSGTARIALGAAERLGGAFPIVPVGLVFHDQRRFRSPAHVVVGEAFDWSDLAGRGERDKAAVRELTRRIDAAMRAVTLNLDSWEDDALVRFAEAVWVAEFDAAPGAPAALARLQEATAALRTLRGAGDPAWRPLARALRGHERALARLHATPATLRAEPSAAADWRWLLPRLPLLPLVPLAIAAWLPAWIPLRVTGRLTDALSEDTEDTLPTYRILAGAVVFAGWFLLLAAVVGIVRGPAAGALTLLAVPAAVVAGTLVAEWHAAAWRRLRGLVARRRVGARLDAARERQRALAMRLAALYERWTHERTLPPPASVRSH